MLHLLASAAQTADPTGPVLPPSSCVWAHGHVLNLTWWHCTHNKSHDFRISAEIQRHGCYECHAVAFVLHTLRLHAGTFVDAGANIGTFSVPAAADGHFVHSFEPVPRNAMMLRDSLNVNEHADRTHVYETALGVAQGWVSMNGMLESGNNQGGFKVPTSYQKGGFGEQRPDSSRMPGLAPVVRLDDVLPPIDGPVVFKIDIEGSECDALAGGARFLNRTDIKLFMMEWWDVRSKCCTALQQGAFASLQGHGLMPYAEFHSKQPFDAARLCERRYGPQGFQLLVWR